MQGKRKVRTRERTIVWSCGRCGCDGEFNAGPGGAEVVISAVRYRHWFLSRECRGGG
jgi:hypothetical protein